MRADSHNGYICDVDVYTGKEDSVETALGSKVVKKLSQQLVGGNYHLYFDNYFTSIPLLEDLLEDGLYACGTFRRDRKGVPDAIKNTKLGKFQMVCTSTSFIVDSSTQVNSREASIVFGREATSWRQRGGTGSWCTSCPLIPPLVTSQW